MSRNSSIADNDEHEELPREDIEEIIGKKINTTNYKLLSSSLEPLSERLGLLGDHSLLNVTIIQEDSTKTNLFFFVKFFPKMESPAIFAEGTGAFNKEVFVYHLLSKFKNSGIEIITQCTTNCYLIRENKYLVFDNLLNQGFKTINKHEMLDYDQMLTVLHALSQLHASSLIYEEKRSQELGEKYRLVDEFSEELEESFFNDKEGFINEKGIEASIKCVVKETELFKFPEKLPSGKRFPSMVKELCYQIFDLVKPSKKHRNVLCHGDLWATNLLIKYKDRFPIKCKFVDFQCGRYVPPSQDVMSVIYLTTSRDFREKYMYQVIGVYYSYLEKQIKNAGYDLGTIIPFNEFLESCEEQKVFAIVQTAIYFPLILISNDLIEEYFSNKELNEKALFEDRTYLVLKHMDDDSYASRLKDSINNLREYCNYR